MQQTVTVRTAQNVFIEYPIASLGDRMLAFLIDAIILTAYNLLCYYLLSEFEINSRAIQILIVTVPFILYHPLFEIFMNGQSPGKRQMKIKVVSIDGASPSIGAYLMRWLFRVVEVLMLRGALAIVTIAASGKGQRLGDIAAGTTVVKLISNEGANRVFTVAEDNYEPVFNQVMLLSDHDVELIQQALVVNRESGNTKPVELVSQKVKSFLGIESDLPSVKFLYTIAKDYSYYTSHAAQQ